MNEAEEFGTVYAQAVPKSKVSGWVAAPTERPKGHSKREAMRIWRVTEYRLNVLEQHGKLHGLQVGQRVFFSRAELVEVLGEPPNPTGPRPFLKRHQGRILNGDSASGG